MRDQHNIATLVPLTGTEEDEEHILHLTDEECAKRGLTRDGEYYRDGADRRYVLIDDGDRQPARLERL